jgi:hypothetical protein
MGIQVVRDWSIEVSSWCLEFGYYIKSVQCIYFFRRNSFDTFGLLHLRIFSKNLTHHSPKNNLAN